MLKDAGVRISMDGKGRWVDNVFVERLWRSVKCEEVYLNAYASFAEANRRLAAYFDFSNRIRTHKGLEGMIPDAAYFAVRPMKAAHNARELSFPPRRALVCVACAARAPPWKGLAAQFITYPPRIPVQSNGATSQHTLGIVYSLST